ncbi:MAG: orotidine-5'-phosphate decarboxylase [Bacteroidota bacterium]
MDASGLYRNILPKASYLCVGLDSDMDKIPGHLKKEQYPVFEFNRAIVEATHKYCVAYKINTAFYEALGSKGWETLKQTAAYIKENHPEIFLIADAKRGDIGNTAQKYAQTFFSTLNFDAVTIAPYMGRDSIQPFLEYTDKWVVILGLTSNKGAADFQYFHSSQENQYLYEKVITEAAKWGSEDNTMFVVGATRPEELKRIRNIIPNHFLLVPGVGAQGGSLEEVSRQGMNHLCGLLINASRSIIFADSSEQFAATAAAQARKMQQDMKQYLIGTTGRTA